MSMVLLRLVRMHRIEQNSKYRWQNRREIQDGTHYLKSEKRERVSPVESLQYQ
jgi:hypothetical protein